jgi:hypothetical protein
MAKPKITIPPLTIKDLTRFMSKFTVSTEHFYKGTPCWDWQGNPNTSGYGIFQLNGKSCLAYRVSFQWFSGPLHQELTPDHLCRRRICVNPIHLEEVPGPINTLRGDTLNAYYAARTHCEHGHEFNEKNTGWQTTKAGKKFRLCLACRWIRNKERRAKNGDAIRAYHREYRRRNLERVRGYEIAYNARKKKLRLKD